MNAENISKMGTQVRDNVAEIAEKAKERLDETYDDLGRSVRRAKAVAEDRLDEVRVQVKDRPIASVATVAGGAFAIGLVVGLLLGRNRR
jgi:ElaB/YqjD/DUF883 family membrane-anchored ribosome-binding protein